MAARLLVVEDDLSLARGIVENLAAEGYTVSVTHDGAEALGHLAEHACDLVILDVMLPGIDGLTLCRRLRARGSTIPVLFLTARGSTDDRVSGLEAGADEYLVKPFNLREFLLRVRAILRRTAARGEMRTTAAAELAFGGNHVDLTSLRARAWDGAIHDLSEKEAAILGILAAAGGAVVTREALVEEAWGIEVYPPTSVVDQIIARLRARFEQSPERPLHLQSAANVGYRFDARAP